MEKKVPERVFFKTFVVCLVNGMIILEINFLFNFYF